MSNDNNDDGIAVLIGLGILAVVGIGVYRVLKAIAEYQPNETISKAEATQVASNYSAYQSSTESEDDEDEYYPDYWAEDEEDADD